MARRRKRYPTKYPPLAERLRLAQEAKDKVEEQQQRREAAAARAADRNRERSKTGLGIGAAFRRATERAGTAAARPVPADPAAPSALTPIPEATNVAPTPEEVAAAEEAAKAEAFEAAAAAEIEAELKTVRRKRPRRPDAPNGLGVVLQRFEDKENAIAAARAEHAAVVQEYLLPYVRKLSDIEASLPGFRFNTSIPWPDIENDVLDPTNAESMADVARRFGVAVKLVYEMSRRRKWTKRRALLGELHARTSSARAFASAANAMVGGNGNPQETIADDADELAMVVKEMIAQLRTAVQTGEIPWKSWGDVEKALKVALVVQGRADSIRENRSTVTQKDLEAITRRVVHKLQIDPILAGLQVQEADFEVADDPARDPDVEDAEAEAAATVLD
jgi:hypothetical protein